MLGEMSKIMVGLVVPAVVGAGFAITTTGCAVEKLFETKEKFQHKPLNQLIPLVVGGTVEGALIGAASFVFFPYTIWKYHNELDKLKEADLDRATNKIKNADGKNAGKSVMRRY